MSPYSHKNNQLATSLATYDGAGNVIQDTRNAYVYDPEGRLCAVEANPTGSATYTQYIYDAEGRRVAKGSGTSLSCGAPTTANGFTLSSQYLLDQSGNQASELGATGNWVHSNIWEGGRLTGTYTSTGLHFAIADPLGTKRVQAVVTSSGTGAPELNCLSLPFGNNVGNTLLSNCVAVGSGGTDATENHFTGKERDPESGDDYFEARYYNSAAGRFLSPDWSAKEEPVPYAKLDDPQTLNLYDYVRNNPVTRVDADGHVAGVDDAAEATVAAVVIGAIALEAGVQAYNRSPEGQRSLNTFTSGVSESFSSSVNSVKSTISGWFSKKSAPPPPPGKATTGPKAADAPGVSAGGQATDAHGNKVGPSGDVQVNKTKSTTREGARNKALGEGSGAVEHATPTVGAPHFHPTGADGEKKPSSTHHEYPN